MYLYLYLFKSSCRTSSIKPHACLSNMVNQIANRSWCLSSNMGAQHAFDASSLVHPVVLPSHGQLGVQSFVSTFS